MSAGGNSTEGKKKIVNIPVNSDPFPKAILSRVGLTFVRFGSEILFEQAPSRKILERKGGASWWLQPHPRWADSASLRSLRDLHLNKVLPASHGRRICIVRRLVWSPWRRWNMTVLYDVVGASVRRCPRVSRNSRDCRTKAGFSAIRLTQSAAVKTVPRSFAHPRSLADRALSHSEG